MTDINHNVTEREKMKEILRESEKKYHSVYDSMNEGVALHQIIYDEQGETVDYTIIDVNPAYESITGLKREKAVGSRASELYGIGNSPYLDIYAKVAATGQPTSFETYFPPIDKHFSISVFSLSKGQFATVFTDITAHKKAEKALISEKERLAVTLRSIGDGVIATDTEGKIVLINKVAEKLTGWPQKEAFGKPLGEVFRIINEKTSTPCENPVENVLKTGVIVGLANDTVLVSRDGKERILADSGAPIRDGDDKIIGVVLVFRDITKRKQTEKQLKYYTENLEKLVEERTDALSESEEKLKVILSGIGDFVTIQNKNLDIIWANQSIKDIWGDVIGKKCYEVYKGLTVPCPDCYVEKVFNEGKTVVSERVDIGPDGKHIHLLITSSPVKDAEGNIVAIAEMEKDITERKNLERKLEEYTESLEKIVKKRKELELRLKNYTENLEKMVEERTKALRESEEKLKAILAGIGDLITIQNKELDVIWANQPMKDIYGEDIIGLKCYDVYKGLLAEKCPDCTVENVLSEEKTFISEQINTLPDGRHVHTLVSSSPMRDVEGNIVGVVEVVKDITKRKNAEEALKESEERYRGLYESSIDGIASLDLKGHIVECNQAFAEMLGYTKEELYNLTTFDLTPSKWLDTNKRFHKQLLTTNYSKELEKEYYKKDGSIIHVSIKGWPIREKEGKPIGMWGIIRDITERKQAEKKINESEKKYSTIVEKGNDGIIIIQDGLLKFANSKMVETTGFSLEDAIEKPFINFVAPEYKELVIDRYKKRLSGKEVSNKYEIELFSRDGRKIPIEISASVIEYEGRPADMAILRDITERREAEEKLKQTLEELSRSNSELEKFAYITSHDLQEPLRMVASFLQLLEHRYKDKLDEDANEFIAFAVDGANRLKGMIKDLLTYSRVGTRGKSFELFDSKEALDLALINLKMAIEESNAVITNDLLPNIMADRSQLIQLFQNLIGNAIKFRGKALPRVHVSARQEGSDWIFSVRDNGIGVDPKYFDRIFDVFQRLHSRDEYPGSGIGLSICKKIVERHNGRIWVESQPENGSTFFFTIPLRHAV
ncbi:PAS domain S-box protein [Candidatus Borrarchaeum sp.]|uniref:PAS domain S-box protein n=1 Tax=Candidatus Borrarchaeum sp. TaxID=2846742 RepID=UPI002580C8F7|nr:PAS domain S-box protein [Candidatus Borrarchaeum sp.]